ncbi:MAG: DUF2169 domain-containing protein [Myxococcota bacterium]|nr:DUF2169 domain-containing protein [Myxococcota bacterium]
MRYVKSTPLEVGYRVWQLRPPQPSISIAVKGTFDPALADPAPFAEEQLPTTGEAHWDDDVERSLRHASDLPLFKPKGECVVVGRAWAPGGRPATSVACRFRIGPVEKDFAVFGDRRWERGLIQRLSAPEPFTSMPLAMERAYGGPGFAANPYGAGRTERDGGVPLPNLEQPRQLIDSPSSKPAPVIVGPLPMMWPGRARYAGTYDAAYMRERWPWLPADFDWRFYLAAPVEQQLREGFWRGDEPIAFEGLHPSAASIRSRLPCIQPRICLDYAGMDRFQEVQTVLDTVVWDAELGKLICVWRGMAEVPSESLEELAHVFVTHEALGGPHRPTAELRAEMQRLLDEEEAEEEEAEGEAPPSFETPPSEPEEPEAEAGPEADEEVAEQEPDPVMAELQAKIDSAQAKLAAMGLDSGEGDAPSPDPAAMLERLEASGAEVPPELKKMVEELGAPEPEAPGPEPAPEPEPPPPGPEGRALVEALLAAGEPLRELDLSELDLRGLDLSGQDLSGSILRGAQLEEGRLRGAIFVGAVLSGAVLSRADLRGADLTSADLSEAQLDGVDLGDATLEDADLEEAKVRLAKLERVKAARASFVRADLIECAMRGADFTEADFEGANLTGVQAPECVFLDATLEEARADRAVFDGSVMRGVRGEGLSAEEARFGGVDADDSFWERARLSRADFSLSKLARADFSDAILIGAEMDGCELTQARFERANAHSLRARKANLFEAVLESADLSFADLRGANLFGAETWRANTSQAQLALANVNRTKLA